MHHYQYGEAGPADDHLVALSEKTCGEPVQIDQAADKQNNQRKCLPPANHISKRSR
jgi:hypothetical protein